MCDNPQSESGQMVIQAVRDKTEFCFERRRKEDTHHENFQCRMGSQKDVLIKNPPWEDRNLEKKPRALVVRRFLSQRCTGTGHSVPSQKKMESVSQN